MKLLYLIFTISQTEGWCSEFGANNEVIFLFRESSCSFNVYVVAFDSNGYVLCNAASCLPLDHANT